MVSIVTLSRRVKQNVLGIRFPSTSGVERQASDISNSIHHSKTEFSQKRALN